LDHCSGRYLSTNFCAVPAFILNLPGKFRSYYYINRKLRCFDNGLLALQEMLLPVTILLALQGKPTYNVRCRPRGRNLITTSFDWIISKSIQAWLTLFGVFNCFTYCSITTRYNSIYRQMVLKSGGHLMHLQRQTSRCSFQCKTIARLFSFVQRLVPLNVIYESFFLLHAVTVLSSWLIFTSNSVLTFFKMLIFRWLLCGFLWMSLLFEVQSFKVCTKFYPFVACKWYRFIRLFHKCYKRCE
jgi:hypothetical protein